MQVHGDIGEQYADFAAYAGEDSPSLAAWAEGVVGDDEVRAWLARLPVPKRQPNLVFAAARWHGTPAPGPYAGLRAALLEDDGKVRDTILTRSTQTNEVGRLATLAPAFARVARGEPVALVEVGASAGLCLLPDRHAYAWHTDRGTVRSGSGPVLECDVRGPFPAGVAMPEVAWRRGVDLNPVDVTDDDQVAWLEILVWPEAEDRRRRLRAAVEVARSDPPVVQRGDLVEALPGLVEEAGRHGRVVVFHSAVLAYLEDTRRQEFTQLVTGLVAQGRCHWVSNEGKGVLPEVTATGPQIPAGRPTFVLGIDGRATAWTHGHGRSMTWLADQGSPTPGR